MLPPPAPRSGHPSPRPLPARSQTGPRSSPCPAALGKGQLPWPQAPAPVLAPAAAWQDPRCRAQGSGKGSSPLGTGQGARRRRAPQHTHAERCGRGERSGSGELRSPACFFLALQLKRGEKLTKTELWKQLQARSGFRPDPQQLSAACQMFRRDANVRENKSVAGSRSLPGRHTAAHGSAPREAGTELRGGRGRFLPPGIVPPGSPGLAPAAGYFCSKVLSGVNLSPPALGTFLRAGPRQGRGAAPAMGAQPRVSARARCSPAGPGRRRPQGGFGKAAPELPRRAGARGAGTGAATEAASGPRGPWGRGAAHGDISVATAARREGRGGPGLPAARVPGDVLGRGRLLFRGRDGPQSRGPKGI